MRAAGDIEQSLNYAPGSTEAVVLHTVVGGAVASLSGGNVAQGALGAGVGEYATGVVSDQLAKDGTDPYSTKGKALLDLTSLVAGAVAGGGSGATTSLAGEQYNQQLHPDYVLHLQSEAKTFAEQQCGCDLSGLPADQQQETIDNATNTLLQTAQRMQDDTFNAKFNGAPMDTAAVAFIQNDDFGEWIGGKYYDLSQATAAQKADPNINGYALYTQLNSNTNGGIGALMPATGYSLEQYAVLARNDYNSGRPQSQTFDVQFQQWGRQDSLNFLKFNGTVALAGATAGAGPLIAGSGIAIGTASGGVGGYVSGGWKGAVVGAVVGATVGKFAPGAVNYASRIAGGGLPGIFAGTTTFVSMNAVAGAGGAYAGNLITGQPWYHDLGYGTAIGAFAPLGSGEAFVSGAGGEAVFGTGVANAFSAYTGLLSVGGTAIDPNSDHGVLRNSSENQSSNPKQGR
jgi:hypothetical protein